MNHTDHYDHYGMQQSVHSHPRNGPPPRKEIPVITEVNAVTFRQNLGEMLNKVQYRNDHLVITKDGKPVAALVDARMFERLQRMQARFEALCERIEQGFAKVAEEDGIKEINAALAVERKKTKSQPQKG
jgi:prevent-host-death family protein